MRAKLTIPQLQEAHARVKAGASIPALAREYGMSRENLWRRIRRMDQGLKLGHAWESDIRCEVTETMAAYLAGLYDGEGSLSFRGDGTYLMRIGMTYEPVIRYLGTIAGTIFPQTWEDKRGNRKPMWTWTVARQRDVLFLLKVMRPFLTVKAEKADQCIADLEERLKR